MTHDAQTVETISPVEVVDEPTGDPHPEANLEPDDRGSDVSGELGGVQSVMFVGWDRSNQQFDAMALRVFERTRDGQLVFELPDPEWSILLERDYGTVCLTAQVDDRFVTVEGRVERVERDAIVRLVVEPTRRTFWDLASGQVFQIASETAAEANDRLDRSAPLILEARPATSR